MGVHNILINETRKEFIDPNSLGCLYKPNELAWNDVGSVVSMSKAWHFLTNEFVTVPYPWKDKSKCKLIRSDSKIWDIVNKFGSWSGDHVRWDILENYYTKDHLETLGGKKYIAIHSVATKQVELNGYEQLVEPIYKSIGHEVRSMFEFWHNENTIREYDIGKPVAQKIEDEEYYSLEFIPWNFGHTYLERKKEARKWGEDYPYLRVSHKYILKYRDGRKKFWDGMINTSDKEAIKNIKKLKEAE